MGTRRGYWSRRSYTRLEASPSSSSAAPAAIAAPRRRWRLRLRRPRLRFLRRALGAPVRALARLRDAYVRMMLRVAGSGALGGTGGFGALAGPPAKEYDEKVLVEIYRSLVAQGHILVTGPMDGGVPTARIVPARAQLQLP